MIQSGKELKVENVLSLRKRMTQEEINIEMGKIGKFLQDNEIKKVGSIITATFAIEENCGRHLMDMEILVPIDKIKEFDFPGEYIFKPLFHIFDAVYARHEGNPATLQNTYNEILDFIQQNKLQQVTAGYNVQVKDFLPGMTADEIVIDVYIGVSRNVL